MKALLVIGNNSISKILKKLFEALVLLLNLFCFSKCNVVKFNLFSFALPVSAIYRIRTCGGIIENYTGPSICTKRYIRIALQVNYFISLYFLGVYIN